MDKGDLSDLYNDYYYEHYNTEGWPYERNEGWLSAFQKIADQIATRIQPKTALDAGCAFGFLVETLRNAGVEAYGVDISKTAIENAHESIQPYCWVGSITEPFPQKYDLIVSIEVLEHLRHADAETAVANFCSHADDILVSSTPFEFKDVTHINIQPPEYWAELFALQGFYRDIEFDGSFISPWTMRFQRKKTPASRVVRDYEKKFFRLGQENTDLRELAIQHRQELEGYEQQIKQLSIQLDANQDLVKTELAKQEKYFKALLAEKNQQISGLQQAQLTLMQITSTRGYKVLTALQNMRVKIIPRHSRREKLLNKIWGGFGYWKREGFVAFIRRLAKETFQNIKFAWYRLRGRNRTPAQEFVLALLQTKKEVQVHQSDVDIIVCVHNAFADVRRCLESLIRYTSAPYHLILVDDGSGVETKEYLEEFSRYQAATLIRNDEARGYTRAANQGLQRSSAELCILLNSDTILTPGWLDRMVECALSDPKIGMVGPLSNTASWQSAPEIFDEKGDWAENRLGEGQSPADMAAQVSKYSERLYPRIPFLNGFCLMIKRDLIDQIGYLDEENFGEGYGEENDYCMRARQAGRDLAVADDVYIYHAQSRSYSHERRMYLAKKADLLLNRKYDNSLIVVGVRECQFSRVMLGNRARMHAMASRERITRSGLELWEGKRVLFILPLIEPGGGGHVIIQEALAMLKMGVDVRFANRSSSRPYFPKAFPDVEIPVIYIDDPIQAPQLLEKFDAVIGTVYHSLDWLDFEGAKLQIKKRGYYIQDYEPNFFKKGTQEYKEAYASYTRFPDLIRITKTEWNREAVREHVGVDCSVVGPSIDIDLFRPRPRTHPDWPDRPLRVVAMIRPSTPRRGPKRTMQVLKEFAKHRGDTVEIILFGCKPDEYDFLELPTDFPWRHLGILTRPEIASLFNEVDIFVDFSDFQAMGLTAMEAMACGVAVILPEYGGAASFAQHEQNALVIDTKDEQTCLDALNKLTLDQALREKLQQQAIFDMVKFSPETAAYNTLEAIFGAGEV